MAIPKPALVGGIALALILLTSGKSKAGTTSTSSTKKDDKPKEDEPKKEEKLDEEKPGPGDEPKDEEPKDEENPIPKQPKEEPLPEVDEPSEEDINDLPKSEDKDPDNVDIQFKFDQFYSQWLQNNNEQPLNPSTQKLWVSNSCSSWGIGKEWLPWLWAKYVYSENDLKAKGLDPDKPLLPTDWIILSKTATSPDPVYVFSLPGDTIYYQWTRNIIDLYTGCGASIPKRKNYTTFKAYYEALKNFEQNTSIGKLFGVLSERIRGAMYQHWAQQHPDLAAEEDLKGWALLAVRKFPKYSYVEQTDQAYKLAFPDGPKKINPKLASHQPYQKAWVNLSQYVKMYRELVKQYG